MLPRCQGLDPNNTHDHYTSTYVNKDYADVAVASFRPTDQPSRLVNFMRSMICLRNSNLDLYVCFCPLYVKLNLVALIVKIDFACTIQGEKKTGC